MIIITKNLQPITNHLRRLKENYKMQLPIVHTPTNVQLLAFTTWIKSLLVVTALNHGKP